MDEFDLGWVVGLLEGEGCFGYTSPLNRGHVYVRECLQLAMTDRDVIEKFLSVTGLTNSITERKKVKEHHSTVYAIKVTGANARRIMEMVAPHMGDRRRNKIEQILDNVISQSSKL